MNETKFFVSYSFTDEATMGKSGFGSTEIISPSTSLTYDFVEDVRKSIKKAHLERYGKDRVIIVLNIIKLDG